MDAKSYTLKNADFTSVVELKRRSPLKASKKLGAMYSPNEIDPHKMKDDRASAGIPIGYNQHQSVGLFPANSSYLDNKVMTRKPI